MPWSTLETRWFLSGLLAESGSAVEAWFRSRPRYGGSDEPALIAWEPASAAWRQDGLFRDGAAHGVVTVEKRRLQRHLCLDPSGAVVEVGPDDPRERGVNVELAQIRIAGSPGSHSGLH